MAGQQEEHQEKSLLVERDMVLCSSSSSSSTNSEMKETEEDILEIIEESSVAYDDNDDKSGDEEHKTNHNMDSLSDLNDTNHSKSTQSHGVEFEFSLSSITFALGDVLQGSAAKWGDAIIAGGKLRQLSPNNNHKNKTVDPLSSTSQHSSLSVMRAKLRSNSNHHNKKSKVDFGAFEDRAVRLRYTADDVFEIVDDPHQFQELKNALRNMGAVTDTLIKQKLHWYVRNNKRERARQALLLQEQQQQLLLQQQQQQQEERRRRQQEQPVTPPTESKVMDTDKVLKDSIGNGISELDPSPKSVRGIFVPPSSS